jgi:uncharacterized tellurite resistance protein B-like protein
MHILAAIGAALGVALLILWRMQQASTAVRDVAEAADDVRGLFRRWTWRRKANTNPLDVIADPREAAIAMMIVTAQADGALTERERLAILAQMSEHFGATSRQGEELLARGRWLVQDKADPAEIFRRLTPIIRKSCGPKEQQDLLAMLRTVAAADGAMDETIKHDIDHLAHVLKG